jgi:hypothetical protein
MRIGPVPGDEVSMPPQQRLRLDKEDRPAVTTQPACQRGEDGSVVGFEPCPRDLTFKHGELMTQDEDLDILRTIATSA